MANRDIGVLRITAWALGLLLPGAAGASAGDAIAKARQECASYKQQVRLLERFQTADAELAEARRNWELACFRAHALMRGTDPGTPPQVAKPPVQLRMAGSMASPPRARREPRSRFKVTVLDPAEEALRLEPPRTQGAGPEPKVVGEPVPLF